VGTAITHPAVHIHTILHVDTLAENLKAAMATFEDGHQKWLKTKRWPLPCDVA